MLAGNPGKLREHIHTQTHCDTFNFTESRTATPHPTSVCVSLYFPCIGRTHVFMNMVLLCRNINRAGVKKVEQTAVRLQAMIISSIDLLDLIVKGRLMVEQDQ